MHVPTIKIFKLNEQGFVISNRAEEQSPIKAKTLGASNTADLQQIVPLRQHAQPTRPSPLHRSFSFRPTAPDRSEAVIGAQPARNFEKNNSDNLIPKEHFSFSHEDNAESGLPSFMNKWLVYSAARKKAHLENYSAPLSGNEQPRLFTDDTPFGNFAEEHPLTAPPPSLLDYSAIVLAPNFTTLHLPAETSIAQEPQSFSKELVDFSETEIIRTLRGMSLAPHEAIVQELREQNSLEEMVGYVQKLYAAKSRPLLVASHNCEEFNRAASQILALFYLLTLHLPPRVFRKEFMDLLPPKWPRAMEKWREPCLRLWPCAGRGYNEQRAAISEALNTRYGSSA